MAYGYITPYREPQDKRVLRARRKTREAAAKLIDDPAIIVSENA